MTFTLQVLFRVTPIFTALIQCEALVDFELRCVFVHQIQAFRSCLRILEEGRIERSLRVSSLNHLEIDQVIVLVEKNFYLQSLTLY